MMDDELFGAGSTGPPKAWSERPPSDAREARGYARQDRRRRRERKARRRRDWLRNPVRMWRSRRS